MDRAYVAYAMIGFGGLAGVVQRLYCRREIARGAMRAGSNPIANQFYGLVIFTAFCSAPLVVLARVLTGQTIF